MKESAFVTHLFRGARRHIPVVLMCLLPLFALFEQVTYARTVVLTSSRTHHRAPQNTAVLTFHNDLFRSGQNTNETILNTKNVNSRLFGKRVSYRVDGQKGGIWMSGEAPSVDNNGYMYLTTGNGNTPGTGIVWVNGPSRCFSPGCNPQGPGVLRAYDATNVSRELCNSQQHAARDGADSYIKFSVPTIADGKVFVGTATRLDIYGLLAR